MAEFNSFRILDASPFKLNLHMKKKYIHNSETHRIDDAEVILPLVFKEIFPKSVVDVGCGTGTFLAACEKLGVVDILGVDGDYVDRSMLRIKPEQFMAADLSKPLSIERRFDLVICLEVAEHIAPESAEIFVESLVGLGDFVLFSAAVPGQGGQNHLNERIQPCGLHSVNSSRRLFWPRSQRSKNNSSRDCDGFPNLD